MGKEYNDLSLEDMCDLMCGGPEEDNEELLSTEETRIIIEAMKSIRYMIAGSNKDIQLFISGANGDFGRIGSLTIIDDDTGTPDSIASIDLDD